MRLEDQLSALVAIGIRLDDGVTVDDLLYSFPRAQYEDRPFHALLFMLGAEIEREPWGRPFSSVAWNFDPESIEAEGDYTRIISRIAALAGRTEQVTEVADNFDPRSGAAWLSYTIDATTRRVPVEVFHDWADQVAITTVLSDFETGDRYFYGIENGQSTILYYLTAEAAAQLNALAGDVAIRLVPPTSGGDTSLTLA